MNQHNKSGYIMMLALIMISLLVVIVTYIATRSHTFSPLAARSQEQLKARALALSGVQVGIAQLVFFKTGKKEQGTKPASGDEIQKKFLEKLLPVLNKLQTFGLKKATDGIEGRIQICISSEDGKIDLNQLWDFQKNQFAYLKEKNKDEWQKLYEALFAQVSKIAKTNSLFSPLQNFLKERGYLINDPTELLLIKEYQTFKNTIFYDPEKKNVLYLTDLFTVWTGRKTIEPWLLSQSLKNVLELQSEEQFDQALKNFKVENNWKTAWDQLFLPLYKKNLASLPKNFELLLSAKFEPKIFSILSYGTFEGITSTMLAIIELVEKLEKEEKSYHAIIRKIYWL